MLNKVKKSLEDAYYYLLVAKKNFSHDKQAIVDIETIETEIENALYDLEEFVKYRRTQSTTEMAQALKEIEETLKK